MRKGLFAAVATLAVATAGIAYSPDYQYALQFRDYVKELIDDNQPAPSICGTVDLYSGKDPDALVARVGDLFEDWQYSILGGEAVPYGNAYVLDTDARDPRAFGIAGVFSRDDGATYGVFVSRCELRK
jgi:hypothetical protein